MDSLIILQGALDDFQEIRPVLIYCIIHRPSLSLTESYVLCLTVHWR